jgi:outer membrane immunogenic protein
MKKLLLGSVSTLALAGVAYAADIAVPYKAPPPPVLLWNGFYAGIDGGVTRHDAYFNDLGSFSFGFATHSVSKTGGVLGGYAGWNVQHGGFVFGVEADVNWIGAKAQSTWGVPIIQGNSFPQSQEVDWAMTFRGRAGLAIDTTLIYLTGGLAVGGIKNSFLQVCRLSGPCGPAPAGAVLGGFSENPTRLGWTAGVGFEHIIDSTRWMVRGEVRYTDFGRSTVSCVAAIPRTVCQPGTNYIGEFSNTLLSALIGVGYKF